MVEKLPLWPWLPLGAADVRSHQEAVGRGLSQGSPVTNGSWDQIYVVP